MRKYPCPCCGNLTLESQGEYEICLICFWEDDPISYDHPEHVSSCNHESLESARRKYNKTEVD